MQRQFVGMPLLPYYFATDMKRRPCITHFRLLFIVLFIVAIAMILYLIWHSQQKVDVIDKQLRQNQIN